MGAIVVYIFCEHLLLPKMMESSSGALCICVWKRYGIALFSTKPLNYWHIWNGKRGGGRQSKQRKRLFIGFLLLLHTIFCCCNLVLSGKIEAFISFVHRERSWEVNSYFNTPSIVLRQPESQHTRAPFSKAEKMGKQNTLKVHCERVWIWRDLL